MTKSSYPNHSGVLPFFTRISLFFPATFSCFQSAAAVLVNLHDESFMTSPLSSVTHQDRESRSRYSSFRESDTDCCTGTAERGCSHGNTCLRTTRLQHKYVAIRHSTSNYITVRRTTSVRRTSSQYAQYITVRRTTSQYFELHHSTSQDTAISYTKVHGNAWQFPHHDWRYTECGSSLLVLEGVSLRGTSHGVLRTAPRLHVTLNDHVWHPEVIDDPLNSSTANKRSVVDLYPLHDG